MCRKRREQHVDRARLHRGVRVKVVFDETVDVRLPTTAIDLDSLRRTFSDLFDRAARAVLDAGFDLDDSIVERSLICRAGEVRHEVRAESLGDAGQLAAHIIRSLVSAGVPESCARDATIVGLRAVATIERTP